MASRPRVLLVLFEGLPSTVVGSTVLNHAREMAEAGVAEFEIWAFCCSAALHGVSKERAAAAEKAAGCPVRVFRGVRPAIPGSVALNRTLVLAQALKARASFDVVHARTDYSAAVCGPAKRRLGALLLWDCRGDAAAEQAARLAAKGLPASAVAAARRGTERVRRTAARLCDRAIFVSRPLAELGRSDLGADKPYEIIPTSASETLFFFAPELRAKARAALGFREGEEVFVYSGSLDPYQMFDEAVSTFAALHARDPRRRLLVVTPQAEAAGEKLRGLPADAVSVVSVELAAVNRLLNAADIGIMLRREDPLNRVAMPTKFAEYAMAGLPVLMTDAVPEAAALAQEIGNRAVLENGAVRLPESYDRAAVSRRATARLGRRRTIEQFRRLYRP